MYATFNVMTTNTLDNVVAGVNGIYALTPNVWNYLLVALGGFLVIIVIVRLFKIR